MGVAPLLAPRWTAHRSGRRATPLLALCPGAGDRRRLRRTLLGYALMAAVDLTSALHHDVRRRRTAAPRRGR